jgi:hypothetical protein
MKENITENSKLIAEFMGIFNRIISTGNIHSWSDAPFYYTTENTTEKVIYNISNYCKYHTSWDWLMPVKEKIEMLDSISDFSIGSSYGCIEATNGDDEWNIVIHKGDKTITRIYWLIVEFIKWYNLHKLK